MTTMLIAPCLLSGEKLRVYNGIDTDFSEYPYVVTLKKEAAPLVRMCTGSLITNSWVLSAAHCTKKKIITHIQYGNMSLALDFTELKSRVLKKVPHKGYGNYKHANDIALLLVIPVSIPKFGKISAVDFETLQGLPVKYAGYGHTKYGKKLKNAAFILDLRRPLQVEEAIVSPCYRSEFVTNLICVSPKCSRKQYILPGDSGGPLILENNIVGIACSIVPSTTEQAFTPVSKYIAWIHSIIVN